MEPRENIHVANPTELIERLKANPEVLGILQYGSGISPEAADTDICVVLRRRPEGLESIHFWVDCGPVDMNLRTLEEIAGGEVAGLPGFDDVLREGKVLYEREPGLLAGLSARRESKPSPPTPAAVDQMRFGYAHFLQKLDYYKARDPLLCNVLLCGAVHWLVRECMSIRRLPYRGEKPALEAIKANDPDLLADLETASGGGPLAERVEAARRLAEKVLAPIGGPWRPGEVLFFSDREHHGPQPTQQWQAFFDSLLGR